MRKYLLVLYLLLIPFMGCAQEPALTGVFVDLQTYNSWIQDPNDELLVVRNVTVDGIRYKSLPHSLVINNSEKVFVVPGGKWKILKITSLKKMEYQMMIASMENNAEHGELIVKVIGDNEIYFRAGDFTPGILKEIKTSFLEFGADHSFRKCAMDVPVGSGAK